MWPRSRRRPQVYTSVKRVHSVWLHGQGFTKVHCVGPILPQHTVTHMHTPPQCTMPTQDTDNGVGGGCSGLPCSTKFLFAIIPKCINKISFFPIFDPNLYLCSVFFFFFSKLDMVLHSAEE